MEKCFAVYVCKDLEGVSSSDLDRFTDKIENILNDENGRKIFRNFLITCKMKQGRRALDLWDHNEKLLLHTEDPESSSFRNYLRDVKKLKREAERVEELDFATVEKLAIACDAENKDEIGEALKIIKVESTKALRREYNAFRQRYMNHMPK